MIKYYAEEPTNEQQDTFALSNGRCYTLQRRTEDRHGFVTYEWCLASTVDDVEGLKLQNWHVKWFIANHLE